jgi:hypothetical protein
MRSCVPGRALHRGTAQMEQHPGRDGGPFLAIWPISTKYTSLESATNSARCRTSRPMAAIRRLPSVEERRTSVSGCSSHEHGE